MSMVEVVREFGEQGLRFLLIAVGTGAFVCMLCIGLSRIIEALRGLH